MFVLVENVKPVSPLTAASINGVGVVGAAFQIPYFFFFTYLLLQYAYN